MPWSRPRSAHTRARCTTRTASATWPATATTASSTCGSARRAATPRRSRRGPRSGCSPTTGRATWSAQTTSRSLSADDPPAESERLVVWAAREIADRVDDGDYEVVFGGIGVSHVASWVYRALCEREGTEARPLLVESGTYDFEPPTNDAYIFTPRALPTAKVVDSSTFGLGLVMATARNLSVLTGAQIDRQGNVNSTQFGGDHFVGSGGANDALSNSDEVVLVVEATPNRLVDEVEYVTGPGRNVTTVVTQYGTLRKRDGDLQIAEVNVPPGESADARLAAFEDAVGWDVDRDADVGEREWRAVDEELVDVLRSVDPVGDFRL